MELTAVGATITGRVRKANEDANHVGDSVFAVADGMGGHLAGEVASATALEPIAILDGRVFGSPEEAADALATAVQEANARVVGKGEGNPDLQGMGTTLTAALYEGRRLHVAHVGDSRAYLLRDGELGQLTKDHTFVQQLLDDGQISPEEAASHPHRSVVTRAIGVEAEVDIDLLALELRPGDQVLLCSDGLSGVVPQGTLKTLLRSGRPPQEVVRALLGAADAAGSPDNVTAVLLVVAGAAPAEPGDGARAPVPTTVRIRPDADAGPLRPLPGPGPDEGLVPDAGVRRRRVAARVVGVAVVVGLFAGGGRWLLSRSFYVGTDGDLVAIHQGIPVSIGPVELGWVDTATSLRIEQVAAYQRDRVVEGIAAVDREDARQIVDRLREEGRVDDAIEQREDAATGGEPDGSTPTDPATSPDPTS
jgi:protein phosphatase